MNSQALASVLAGTGSGGVSTVTATGRKMDRVFTQSMGAQTVSPRYARNGGARNGGGGGNRNSTGGGGVMLDYMMERSQPVGASTAAMYNAPATHYRTLSGSGHIDEYDYVPTPVNYRYDRQPIRRRVRGGGQAVRSYGPPRNNDRRYVSTRIPAEVRGGGGGQMYEDTVPVRNRYRRNSRRATYRSNEWYNDDTSAGPPPPQQRKPAPRRQRVGRSRANTEQQQSQAQQPSAQQQQSEQSQREEGTSNEEGRRRVPRRRRRRTTSIATAGAAVPATSGQQQNNKDQVTLSGIRGRRFACNICRKAFRTDSLRIRHIRFVHPRRREFVCKECRGVFPNARSITTHLSKPHPEERQPADEQRRYPPLGVPTRYVPDGMTIFSCQYCPFGFLNARDAESHKSRCRASQRLSMNIDVEYPGNDQYTMYCFCCPELLSLRQGLKEHFDALHNHIDLTISYHCALCAKKFAEEQEAAEHLKNDHDPEELEELHKKRQESFIEESIVSYQSARPVSMVRVKIEVRQVLAKLLRQVAAKVRSA